MADKSKTPKSDTRQPKVAELNEEQLDKAAGGRLPQKPKP